MFDVDFDLNYFIDNNPWVVTPYELVSYDDEEEVEEEG